MDTDLDTTQHHIDGDETHRPPATYPLGTRYVDNMDVADPNPYTPKRFPVIGQVERSHVGNAVIRAGLTQSQTDHRWEQTLHLVLAPAERDRLTDDLLAHAAADSTWLDEPGPADEERLVWIGEDGPVAGPVAELTGYIEYADLGGYDTPRVAYVERRGRLIPLPVAVASVEKADDWATVTVTVDMGHGRVASSSYRADLRV